MRKGGLVGTVFLWALALLATVYGATCLVLLLFEDKLVFKPHREHGHRPDEIGLAFEDVRFQALDGTGLRGWWIPKPSGGPGGRGLVLFFSGNAGNMSFLLDSVVLFHRMGLNAFVFDYRGYGLSEGRPSEAGLVSDAGGAWRYVTQERGVAASDVVIWGRSLGGAVAADLASRLGGRRPKALVLESTFTSIPDMGRMLFPFLPVGLFSRIRFETLNKAPELRIPTLVIHSPVDEIVPYAMGRRIFDALPGPKRFLELAGGHNEGFLLAAERYVSEAARFLDQPADEIGQTLNAQGVEQEPDVAWDKPLKYGEMPELLDMAAAEKAVQGQSAMRDPKPAGGGQVDE